MMKYLKKFESNDSISTINRHIIDEFDIIMDFIKNLSDIGIEVKSTIPNLGCEGVLGKKYDLSKDDIYKFIEDNIDAKINTFNYQISFDGVVSSSNLDEIFSELDVLKSRIGDTESVISQERFNRNFSYSRNFVNEPKLDKYTNINQKIDGNYIVREIINISLFLDITNKKTSRY